MATLGRALCIITGASKGFGRAVAKEMARLVEPGSAFVLVARSGDELRTLQTELAESGLEARCVVLDLSLNESPERVVRTAKEVFSPDMNHVILVNNAGKLIVSCLFGTDIGNLQLVFMPPPQKKKILNRFQIVDPCKTQL